MASSCHLYPVDNYTFGKKDPLPEKENETPDAQFERMRTKYAKEGLKRTVEGVLITHKHNHPHLLLLKHGHEFMLPGGRLKPGEADIDGLKRKLTKKLSPKPATTDAAVPDWDVADLLGTWCRPNFGQQQYPYVPAHVTKPKECRKVFLVPLPDKSMFAVPKNLELVAVALFELYNNEASFGAVISTIPQLLSRFTFITNGPEVSEVKMENAEILQVYDNMDDDAEKGDAEMTADTEMADGAAPSDLPADLPTDAPTDAPTGDATEPAAAAAADATEQATSNAPRSAIPGLGVTSAQVAEQPADTAEGVGPAKDEAGAAEVKTESQS